MFDFAHTKHLANTLTWPMMRFEAVLAKCLLSVLSITIRVEAQSCNGHLAELAEISKIEEIPAGEDLEVSGECIWESGAHYCC